MEERYQKALTPAQRTVGEDWLFGCSLQPYPEPRGFAPDPSRIQVPPATGVLVSQQA